MDIHKAETIKALKTPYKPMLDYALTFVSLSEKQRACLELCIIQDLTEEEAAERLNRSRDFVARHKLQAIERCCKAWQPYSELISQMCEY